MIFRDRAPTPGSSASRFLAPALKPFGASLFLHGLALGLLGWVGLWSMHRPDARPVPVLSVETTASTQILMVPAPRVRAEQPGAPEPQVEPQVEPQRSIPPADRRFEEAQAHTAQIQRADFREPPPESAADADARDAPATTPADAPPAEACVAEQAAAPQQLRAEVRHELEVDPDACPPPEYPRSALRRHQEGVVRVHVHVSAEGRPLEAWIESSSGARVLDRCALEAVRGWRFRPALEDGVPVEGDIVVPIRFRILS